MFEQVLYGNTKSILELLGQRKILGDAYLAGVTGVALQLGHRISIDLDFFTTAHFDVDAMVEGLINLDHFELDEKNEGTILGRFGDVKFSIFRYRYDVVRPFKDFLGINVMDACEIAAMKLEAIATRGKKRDFIDLYYVIKKLASLDDVLSLYEHKYGKSGSKTFHILKSLTYFADAQRDNMPRMLVEIAWDDVTGYFENEVKKISKVWLAKDR